MWEDRYNASDGYLFGKAPAQFLMDNPGWLTSAKHVLVVADGEGRNGVHIASMGANVTAFDLSATAVRRARQLADEHSVKLDVSASEWDDWNWEQAYDLVVAVFIQFVGPAERGKQFANIKSAVKPGGILMLHGYTPEQIELGTGGPPSAENMYTEEILGKYFGNWQIERLARYERDVQEGRGHSGKSALIDMIARKPE